MTTHRHRSYTITYNPKPIPIRSHDWEFSHDDYDGAPLEPGGPPADRRAGTAASLEDAKREIDMIEDERAPTPARQLANIAGQMWSHAEDECEQLRAALGACERYALRIVNGGSASPFDKANAEAIVHVCRDPSPTRESPA